MQCIFTNEGWTKQNKIKTNHVFCFKISFIVCIWHIVSIWCWLKKPVMQDGKLIKYDCTAWRWYLKFSLIGILNLDKYNYSSYCTDTSTSRLRDVTQQVSHLPFYKPLCGICIIVQKWCTCKKWVPFSGPLIWGPQGSITL